MMEAQITFTGAIEITLPEERSEVVAGFLYGGKIALRYPVACQHEGSGLKYFPKFSNLMHIIFGHLCYEVSSALPGANQSFAKQLGQSFPQGSPANFKFRCPILFLDALVWYQFKYQDTAPQFLICQLLLSILGHCVLAVRHLRS